MTSVRLKLSTFAVVGAMLLAFAAPLAAADPTRGVCAARQHDCGRTVQLKPCCCGPQQDDTNPPGPIASTTQIAADNTLVSLAPVVRLIATDDLRFGLVPFDTSPPGAGAADLPTLFSTLLI